MRSTSAVTLLLALTAACAKNPPASTSPAPVAAPPAAATPAPAPPATAAAAPQGTMAAPTMANTPAAANMPAPSTGAVDLTGTWAMSIDAGGQQIPIEIHLARGTSGYTGDASPQGMQAAPLSALTMNGNTVNMTFTAPDGDATFAGTLSADRRTIAGTLNYNGQAIPFSAVKR